MVKRRRMLSVPCKANESQGLPHFGQCSDSRLDQGSTDKSSLVTAALFGPGRATFVDGRRTFSIIADRRRSALSSNLCGPRLLAAPIDPSRVARPATSVLARRTSSARSQLWHWRRNATADCAALPWDALRYGSKEGRALSAG